MSHKSMKKIGQTNTKIEEVGKENGIMKIQHNIMHNLNRV